MKVISMQLAVGDRPKDENVSGALDLVDQAPEADLILLPEIWPSGFFSFSRYQAESESIDGPTVTAFKEKAVARNCHIHMGSLVTREGDLRRYPAGRSQHGGGPLGPDCGRGRRR